MEKQVIYQITKDDLEDIIAQVASFTAREMLKLIQPSDELLTREQAAEMLGVTPKTISNRVYAGALDAIKNGRSLLIRKSSIINSKPIV